MPPRLKVKESPMPARKTITKPATTPNLVELVEQQVRGDVMERHQANQQLVELLATDADFSAAAVRAAELLTEQFGSDQQTLLAIINRHPPADWALRLDVWFRQAIKAKSASDRKEAAYLLVRIGGSERWAAFTPNLHPRDLWERLWQLSESKDRDICNAVTGGVVGGLRACPDRAFAEQFAIDHKLTHLPVEWACFEEDTRALMDRMFAAKVVSREVASPFTIVYELQHGRATEAYKLFARLDDGDQGYQAQQLALYGQRIRPVATAIEWLGMLLGSTNDKVRYKCAWAACEHVENHRHDIGPVLPALGKLMEISKTGGESGYALWWGMSALAVTAIHLPQCRDLALGELTARLTGKAVQREAAGYGLAQYRTLKHDLDGVRELFNHDDAKVCAGAVQGMYSTCKRLPGSMDDFRKLIKPLRAKLRSLASDKRKDVATAATKVNGWL
jgi:hypothetical protein